MAGPTKRAHGGLKVLDDGRIEHTFRQSTLGDLDMCLEKGRRQLAGTLERWESDAASIGTALHGGIEANLEELILDDADMNLSTTIEIAQQTFSDQLELPNFKWLQETEETARAALTRCATAWYEEIRPTLEPEMLEIPFHGLVIHEDEQRVIRINGTMDYLGHQGLADWKTAGSKYKAWEKERWAIQPTVYTLAARLMGIEQAQAEYVPFEFIVMLKSGTQRTQRIKVVRHAGDWRWLVEKCVALAELIEADLAVWPKGDNGWWCSGKWCAAWDSCHPQDPDWVPVPYPSVS
jgi:hypothetical protein